MSSVFIDEGPLGASQFGKKSVSETRHGKYIHIKKSLRPCLAEDPSFGLEGVLVRHDDQAVFLKVEVVNYELFLVDGFPSVIDI